MTGCVTRAGARCAPGALRNLISMSLQVSSNFEEDIVVGLSKFADKAHFHEKAGPCQAVFRSTYSYSRLPTNGRPNLASSLSFLERFFVRRQRYRRSPTSGRRTMLPSRILKSPTRPTSIRTLGGAVAPVPAGCSQLETGAAVSEPNWISLSPATSFLARAAVTRTRRFASNPVKLLSSLLPVDSDFAMARTPRRLPTADAAGCRAFAQLPQPLSSFLACRRIPPGAAPIA